MSGSAAESPEPGGRLLRHWLLDPLVVSMKLKEMLLTPLGPGLAVKVLRPEIVHCRVEVSEQVWRFRWGAARVREARERRERKCMVAYWWLGDRLMKGGWY